LTFMQRGRNVAARNSAVSNDATPLTLRDLRRPRHAGLFEAVHRIDAQLDEASRRELEGWIGDQYSVEYGDVPLGFVALCHLGPPYVDHRLDLLHSIVEHYGAGDSMPEPFAQARMLARTGAYPFVEVYGSGQIIPVRADGSIVVP